MAAKKKAETKATQEPRGLRTISTTMEVRNGTTTLGSIVRVRGGYIKLCNQGKDFTFVMAGHYWGSESNKHATVKDALSAFRDIMPNAEPPPIARPVPAVKAK